MEKLISFAYIIFACLLPILNAIVWSIIEKIEKEEKNFINLKKYKCKVREKVKWKFSKSF